MRAIHKDKFTVYLEPDKLKDLEEIISKYPIKPAAFRSMAIMVGAYAIATMFEEVGISNIHLIRGLMGTMKASWQSGMSTMLESGEQE